MDIATSRNTGLGINHASKLMLQAGLYTANLHK